jgi:hypothetical protein
MSSDRSRLATQPDDGFIGIVAQQGRVILDRDINALQEDVLKRIAAETLDIVGPCGTPDNGFAISAPDTSPPAPFYSPPEASPPPSPQALGIRGDFLISPGVMYLGGQRVEFPFLEYGKRVSYSYLDQPDWPQPERWNSDTLHELVFLDALLQEVGAVEDPDLREVALGGPDTTARLRFLTRVKRGPVEATDCATAWEQAVAVWKLQGLFFDPLNMSLTPIVQMKVGFTEDAGTGDPCDPVATGGYLGSDNQLIRVRIVNDGTTRSIVWGYDNASFLYRIAAIDPDRSTITLAGGPPDAFHIPAAGQVVEILATATVLGSDPDVTDPSGVTQILRVAADNTGGLHALAKPYGPTTQGDPTSYIVLADPVSAAMAASTLPRFLRVWQAELPYVEDAPITLEDPSTGISTGITVTFSHGKVPADGAFWEIAVRPSTPQGVYPEELLERPQLAAGPLRYVCPLAVIDWTKQPPTIADCRNKFDNLVDLSKRKPGCCTVSITPRDLAGRVTLQHIVDEAVTLAKSVTVCLGAGLYPLQQPLRLGLVHSNLTLESCGGGAVLFADPAMEVSRFAEGLILLNSAEAVTLSGLMLQPPMVPMTAAALRDLFANLKTTVAKDEAKTLLRNPLVCFGVHAYNARLLTVTRCVFELLKPRDTLDNDALGAAIFLQGNCEAFQLTECQFLTDLPATYNAIVDTTKFTDFTMLAAGEKLTSSSETPSGEKPAATTLTDHAAAPAASTTTQPFSPLVFGANEEIANGLGITSVLSNRGASPFAARQRALTAVTAVLGLATRPPNSELLQPCRLGDADIGNNQVTGLTFATLLEADFTTLRLRDNRVIGGVGGLWVGRPNRLRPSNMPKLADHFYDTVQNFEEYQLLFGVGAVTQPPKWDQAVLVATQDPAAAPLGENTLIMVSGNHVSTGFHPPPSTDFPLTGSSALLLWMLDTANQDILDRSDVSTMVTGNHLISASLSVPTALLVTPWQQPCAVTGNIMLNRPEALGRSHQAPSLWIVIDHASDSNNSPLAVTGNVLSGTSDVSAYLRTGADTRTGWSPHNADPN